MSDSLQHHGLQHARPPCQSPTPGVYPNSCPLSQWCHLTISSSVVPFSFCLQSFPTEGSFQMSQLFALGGQNAGVSALTSDFQWTPRTDFPYSGLVGSPCSPRDCQESSPTPQFKCINSSALNFLYSPTLTSIHDYWKVLATAIGPKKGKKKCIHIGREEVKLSWFADDVILCMKIPNSSTKKLLCIINEFSEVLEHKSNI